MRCLACPACFVLMFGVHILVDYKINTDADGNPIGLLVPATDPVPATVGEIESLAQSPGQPLHLPTKGNFLIMGRNFIGLAGVISMPLVRFHDKTMLRLSIGQKGASISGEFFDNNKNVIAVLESNRWTLNRERYFKSLKPDKSTLIVQDHQNAEVLNIRFCNRNFFEISGLFRFPDGTEATITKSNCIYHGQTYSGNVCLAGDGGLGIDSDGTVEWGTHFHDRINRR